MSRCTLDESSLSTIRVNAWNETKPFKMNLNVATKQVLIMGLLKIVYFSLTTSHELVTHLTVLTERFPMNTNTTVFR